MLDDALVMQNKTMHEMCDAARAGRQAGRQAARKNYELLRESGEKPNEKKKEMKI